MTLSLATILVVAFAALVKCKDEQQTIRLTHGKFTDMTDRSNTPDSLGQECEGVNRFWVDGDVSYIRLEDEKENFVGSQTGVFEKDVRDALSAKNVDQEQIEKTIEWYKNNPQIQQEIIGKKIAFLMTVYVTDPTRICSDAPSDDRTSHLYVYHKEATPDGDYVKLSRTDLSLTDDGWVQNPCIPEMGTHYRYLAGDDADFDCANWTPAFLLYNGTTNIGWGYNFPGLIENDRFENPSKCFFNTIMDPMPICVTEDFTKNGGYSVMHTYLIENPQSIECPGKGVDPCPPKK